ncbi:MAG TPA: DUF465 domain-containing protein [Rhizomicrobium sp.]|jgi:hypothetical protein|nr:DUF465 domain-containing protein [Rhizomicrobium sp.]
MTEAEEQALRIKLAELVQEHRDLDAAIHMMQHAANTDLLQIARLKKRKLHLKDLIARLENELLPDIIA